MSFESCACVTVTCDGSACQGLSPAPPHFDGFLGALAWVRGHGWLVSDDKLLCPACVGATVRALDCHVLGHPWGEWEEQERDGIRWLARACQRCDADEYDPPLDVLGPQFQALRDAEEILRAAAATGGDAE